MKYIITTILALLALLTRAQSGDSLIGKLLHQEQVFWQAQTDSARFTALLTKAKTEREAGLYSDADNELGRAVKFGNGSKEQAKLEYERMLNYFLSDHYIECSGVTIDSSELGEYYGEYTLMKLYSLNEADNWTACKAMLAKSCDKKDTTELKRINALPVVCKFKSPVKARRLSAIFPGLGETYAGYPFKGFTSLVLNAGFLAFAGYNFYTAYYITGAVSGLFPVVRFYSGGKKLSYRLATEHNEKEAEKLKKKYRKEISLIVH